MSTIEFETVLSHNDGPGEAMIERRLARSAINAGTTACSGSVKRARFDLRVSVDWQPASASSDRTNLAKAYLHHGDKVGVVGGQVPWPPRWDQKIS